MTSPNEILANALNLPAARAGGILRAMVVVANNNQGKITVHAMMDETRESAYIIRHALVALQLSGLLRGRFVPYHKRCDKQIGPDEDSVNEVYRRVEDGDYARLCPGCGDYFDGMEDLVVRIQFSLDEGWVGP